MIRPLPKGYSIDEGFPCRITRRWYGVQHVAMLIFALFWNGILGVMVVGMIRSAQPESGGPPIAVYFMPVFHVAVGLGVLYAALAGLFNRTVFEIAHDFLSVRHGPLPWRGNRTLRRSDLQQLYCKANSHRNKGREYWTYSLCAVTHDSRELVLVKGLDDKHGAQFLESFIEERLGIKDEAVMGEMRK